MSGEETISRCRNCQTFAPLLDMYCRQCSLPQEKLNQYVCGLMGRANYSTEYTKAERKLMKKIAKDLKRLLPKEE